MPAIEWDGEEYEDAIAGSGRVVVFMSRKGHFNFIAPPTFNGVAILGKVNAGAVQGREPETLLIVNGRFEPIFHEDKFLWRFDILYRSTGWNNIYRPQTKRWERVEDKNGKPLYEAVEFPLGAPPCCPAALPATLHATITSRPSCSCLDPQVYGHRAGCQAKGE